MNLEVVEHYTEEDFSKYLGDLEAQGLWLNWASSLCLALEVETRV